MTLKEVLAELARWQARRTFRAGKVKAATAAVTSAFKAFKASEERLNKWQMLLVEAEVQVTELKKRAHALQFSETLSHEAIQFIINEEGAVPFAYNDPANNATFGIGHLLHLGPVTEADRIQWGTRQNPKPELVIPTFKEDLKKYEAAVREAVTPKLKLHEYAALVSLCFNIGIGGFRNSTVVKRLNAGDYNGAASAILMWNRPSILIPRRERERKLFLTGQYK